MLLTCTLHHIIVPSHLHPLREEASRSEISRPEEGQFSRLHESLISPPLYLGRLQFLTFSWNSPFVLVDVKSQGHQRDPNSPAFAPMCSSGVLVWQQRLNFGPPLDVFCAGWNRLKTIVSHTFNSDDYNTAFAFVPLGCCAKKLCSSVSSAFIIQVNEPFQWNPANATCLLPLQQDD